MRNEFFSDYVRYAVQFVITAANRTFEPGVGTFFKVQSGNPWITNMSNLSLINERMDIKSIFGRIKGQDWKNWYGTGGTAIPSMVVGFGMSTFFQEFLENLFLTVKVNNKEYLNKFPAKLLPIPHMLQQAGDVINTGGLVDDADDLDSKELVRHSSDAGGYNLRNPITVFKQDTFEISYQLGSLSDMPIFNHLLNKQRLHQPTYKFWYEIDLLVSKKRDVQ